MDKEEKILSDAYERGDLDAGFAASDVVLEDAFTSKHINNAQLEPRVSVARWDGDRLTVWTPTQGVSNCQRDLARDLDLPPADVRVVCEYMGGGFGNKNQCQDSDLIAAVLARETGNAVKLEYTRKEDFLGVHGRWPTRQYYRVGATRDGTLKAIELRGYSGLGPHRKSSGGIAGIELFRCPNVRRVVHPTYTNMTVSANFRGPAYPQGVWGIESMMDQMAHELEIDPVAFHLKNVSRAYMDETPYTSWALSECIERGAEVFAGRHDGAAPAPGSQPCDVVSGWRPVLSARAPAGAAPCCGSTATDIFGSTWGSPTSAPPPRRRWHCWPPRRWRCVSTT